jgi:phosphoribosylpyrophosphate synthetase
VVSDTIGSVYNYTSPKLKVISCSKLIVDVIDRLVKNESTQELTNAI